MPRERKSTKNKAQNDGSDPPVKATKKRRASNVGANSMNVGMRAGAGANRNGDQMLLPPQPLSSSDTLVALNPFDDRPSMPMHSMQPNMGPMSQGGNMMNMMMPGNGMMGPNMMGPRGPSPGPHGPPMPPGGPMQKPMMGPMGGGGGPMPPNSMMPGRTYPPEQSKVFNPANPNAPPIYPCGICHKEVHDNDQGVLCESGCNFWFHRACTGITERAFNLLNQEVYAEWVCDNCLRNRNIPPIKFKP